VVRENSFPAQKIKNKILFHYKDKPVSIVYEEIAVYFESHTSMSTNFVRKMQ